MDGEQLVEVGALSQRLVCAEASSHWLLKSVCDGVQMQQPFLKRGPAHDSAHATPPPTKRRAKESDFQETVAVEGASTSTAVNQPVAMDPVSTSTAVNQTVAMDPVSTDTPPNQSVTMETDAEQTDAVQEVNVRMTDVKGVGLNKDSAPSQIRGVCLDSSEF